MELPEIVRAAMRTGQPFAIIGETPAMTECVIENGRFYRKLISRPHMRALEMVLTPAEVVSDRWDFITHVVSKEVTAEGLRDAFERLMNKPGLRTVLEREPDLPEHLIDALGLGPR
jgi:hypothetical protein